MTDRTSPIPAAKNQMHGGECESSLFPSMSEKDPPRYTYNLESKKALLYTSPRSHRLQTAAGRVYLRAGHVRLTG